MVRKNAFQQWQELLGTFLSMSCLHLVICKAMPLMVQSCKVMQTRNDWSNACVRVGGWRALSRKLVLPKVINIIITIIVNIINTNIIIVRVG